MTDYLTIDHLLEERIYIDNIPAIRFNLKSNKDKIPTIILYHGWSSCKESQRLRGFILANLGFQVIIPDAIYHGERERLEDYEVENAVKYFWPTILNNMEEADKIIDYCIDNLNTDPHRIGLIGHSMGGFTAAGIFTHNSNIRTAVILNGSLYWGYFNSIFKEQFKLDLSNHEVLKAEEKINFLDPMNNIDKLLDRPILLLHGEKDSLVDISGQRIFYEKVGPKYSDKSLLQLIEYSNLDHFVTTNMMDEAAKWFRKYL